MTTALHKLRQRIYAQTLRDLKPLEGIKSFEVNEILYNRTRVIDDDLVVVNENGTPTGQSYEQFVATIKTARPDCFEPSSEKTVTAGNPFVRGPAYNITDQMRMMRSDPDTARRLEAEAQKKA